MKSIFEQIGGTYTMQGDYRLPNLNVPAEEERPIGVWGQRRLRYLKQHHKVLYYNLLPSGKLHSPPRRHRGTGTGILCTAGKRIRRKGRRNRTIQIRRQNGVGAESE